MTVGNSGGQSATPQNKPISDFLSILMKLPAAAVLIFCMVLVIFTAVREYGDHSLIIDPFSTPKETSDQGVSGTVLSEWLLDRLNELQQTTVSDRAPGGAEVAFNDGLKVEIPETGLSLNDLTTWIRQTWGHQTHVAGDVVKISQGTQLTVRIKGRTPVTAESTAGDLRTQVAQAADGLFMETSPYRYAESLDAEDCRPEALIQTQYLADHTNAVDSGWAYGLWSNLLYENGQLTDALTKAHKAESRAPDLPFGFGNEGEAEMALGHIGAAASAFRTYLAKMKLRENQAASGINQVSHYAHAFSEKDILAIVDELTADYRGAETAYDAALPQALSEEYQNAIALPQASDMAYDHKFQDSLDKMKTVGTIDADQLQILIESHQVFLPPPISLSIATGHWALAAQQISDFRSDLDPTDTFLQIYDRIYLQSWLALAEARSGHPELAAKWLVTPADTTCELCLRLRGLVEAELGRFPDSAADIGAALRIDPSSPFNYESLAELELRERNLVNALKFAKKANSKAPTWSEAIELRGEILTALDRNSEALDELHSAAQSPSDWARLHRALGQALLKLTRYDESKVEFALATKDYRDQTEKLLALERLHGNQPANDKSASKKTAPSPPSDVCAAAKARIQTEISELNN